MNILHLDSSITGDQSASRTLSAAVVQELIGADAAARVTHRDLAAAPLDHLTLPGFATDESRAALSEFQAADVIVIGAPMYNFTIPSQLKAWIDRIAIAGETFRYTETGAAEGLAGAKRVIVAVTRGGLYGADSGQAGFEHVESYLRAVFAFIGVTDLTFVVAEGLKVGEAAHAAAIASAHREIGRLVPQAA